MGNSLQELVNSYFDAPSQGLRNAIITQSMPLVKSIIGKIRKPKNPLSSYEDLESVAVIGLLQSLENYDPEKGIQFNTFAYYRIRGSVIDYLRSIDELPRVQRSKYGKAQEVMSRLQQELGREPEDAEVAQEMGMSLAEYEQLLINVQQRAFLSLDKSEFDNGDNLGERLKNEDTDLPDAELERKSIAERIQHELTQLKERERLILSLYYYEDLTLNEIAVLLGLTEARISQIVGKLLLQLKASLSAVVLD